MKVGIYGQFYQEDSGENIQDLLHGLNKENIEVVIEKEFFELLKQHTDISHQYLHFSTFEELDKTYDLFFSIGGDGTILKTAWFIRDLGIPIVGINTGRLGFLATIHKSEIKKAIEGILHKKYTLVERSLLSVEGLSDNPEIGKDNFALNEIAVSRKNTAAMLTMTVWLDGEYLNAFWADGVILSTPTGSTSYSLSCGGPVILPKTDALVLTPIAPHNLNVRPLVIPDNIEVTMKVSGREDEYLVSMDARITTVKKDTVLTIRKAPFKISLVQLHDSSFIKTLRKKLLWGEDKRNRKH
ncbi:MAG TPA: NAD kinase [Flavobacteriaceae bacterium]|nr:NAD kinase [Flavobacteriaceae bacterium]